MSAVARLLAAVLLSVLCIAPASASSPGAGTAVGPTQTLYTDPSSATDLGAQINTLIGHLPLYTTANGPTRSGVIMVASTSGVISYSTTINMTPLVRIDFQSNIVKYTGSGTAILCDDHPTSYSGWGGLQNGFLQGTSSAAVGVENEECTFFRIRNFRIGGFSNGIAYLQYNAVDWTERTDLENVELDNCATCWEMQNAVGDTIGGFAYTNSRDVFIQPAASGVGFLGVGTGSLVPGCCYVQGHVDMSFSVTTNSTAVHITQGFMFGAQQGGLQGYLTGEPASGATGTHGIVADSGTKYEFAGDTRWWNGFLADSFASGTYFQYTPCLYGISFCVTYQRTSAPAVTYYPNINTLTTYGEFNFANLTSGRTYLAPDLSGGTIALTNGNLSGAQLFPIEDCSKLLCDENGFFWDVSHNSYVGAAGAGPTANSHVFNFHWIDGSSVAQNMGLLADATNDLLSITDSSQSFAGVTLKIGSMITATVYSAAGTPLPSCNTGNKGRHAVVSDANGPTYLGTYTSGGAVYAPVVCNGTNWVTY